MSIRFYRPEDAYGCFSNFSLHEVDIYGRKWKTSEHAFQAMKFYPRVPYMDYIASQPTPGAAAREGRDRTRPLRPDWDQQYGTTGPILPKGVVFVDNDFVQRPGVTPEPVLHRSKDIIMYAICKAKFSQHEDIKQILLGTGSEPLIEDTLHDPYWGWGASHVGENKLGRILMLVREGLRHEATLGR